jgi:hypothetical protein
MVRNRYSLKSVSLEELLFVNRRHRLGQFAPLITRRDAHFKWVARLNKNNQHTMGTEL